MFNKKYIAILLSLTLIFTFSTAVMAHGGAHGGPNNNGYNNNQNFSHGPGMMGNSGGYGHGPGMMGPGFNNDWNSIGHQYNSMMGAMMGHGMMGFNNYGNQNGHFGMMNNYNQFMNDYGPGVNNRNYNSRNTNLNKGEMIELAQELLKERYGNQFQITDMVAYSNSPYYLVVREENKEEAAFALMFDPRRRVVYPEYGPNMMWNRNYGMAFMMGWNGKTNRSRINREQALENAEDFARRNGLRARNKGYQFSGYYSFYVENNNQPVGLVSVNAYSGEVWAHNWHGNLTEIIEVRN